MLDSMDVWCPNEDCGDVYCYTPMGVETSGTATVTCDSCGSTFSFRFEYEPVVSDIEMITERHWEDEDE